MSQVKYNEIALNNVVLHRSRDSPLYGKYPGHRYNPYYPKVVVESKVTNVKTIQGGEGFKESRVWRSQGGGQGKVVLILFYPNLCCERP